MFRQATSNYNFVSNRGLKHRYFLVIYFLIYFCIKSIYLKVNANW
ncbi:hypothetical protein CWATWH0005_4281 [Crocosphaera watsonii WH 0005]|uniref:Uncharacterized protein n=1 Tax=Crocosphaera watsonii WH 0005 TaxID=423472 RepID=T2ILY4_CROWT|nr:hypothetical protein CWATWH0005_4281 [Crocosphaera watsonii WH 0005]